MCVCVRNTHLQICSHMHIRCNRAEELPQQGSKEAQRRRGRDNADRPNLSPHKPDEDGSLNSNFLFASEFLFLLWTLKHRRPSSSFFILVFYYYLYLRKHGVKDGRKSITSVFLLNLYYYYYHHLIDRKNDLIYGILGWLGRNWQTISPKKEEEGVLLTKFILTGKCPRIL